MKIKDIKNIEDTVEFLNSGDFKSWEFQDSKAFPRIITWKKETVCATVSLAKPLEEICLLWRFEVSAANLGDWLLSTVSDKRYYLFESFFGEDFNTKKFNKWKNNAIKYYHQDKRCWESGNRFQEQQEKFAELVKQKYPGTEGAFYYNGDYKYGEQYFEHPKAGIFEVNKDLEIANINVYGDEARKAFRFLAYGETVDCGDE